MLKKISLLLIVVFSSYNMSIFAQNTYDLPLDADGKIEYKKVVEEKADAETLYNRAMTWITANIRNHALKVTLLDESNRVIEAYKKFNIEFDIETEVKGFGGLNTKTETKSYKIMVRYDFKLEFKEGRYRIVLNNFRMASDSGIPVERYFEDEDEEKQEYYEKFFESLDSNAKSFIEAIQQALKEAEEVDDSW